jgi:hypothetical protein
MFALFISNINVKKKKPKTEMELNVHHGENMGSGQESKTSDGHPDMAKEICLR